MAPRIGVGPCSGEPTSLKQGPWAVVQVTVSTDHGSLTLVVRVRTQHQKKNEGSGDADCRQEQFTACANEGAVGYRCFRGNLGYVHLTNERPTILGYKIDENRIIFNGKITYRVPGR